MRWVSDRKVVGSWFDYGIGGALLCPWKTLTLIFFPLGLNKPLFYGPA